MMCVYIFIYIYIYIYICVCVCVYIYIVREVRKDKEWKKYLVFGHDQQLA